jgi:hypothetical protein
VRFAVDEVALAQVFPPVLWVSPVSILPPMLRTHQLITSTTEFHQEGQAGEAWEPPNQAMLAVGFARQTELYFYFLPVSTQFKIQSTGSTAFLCCILIGTPMMPTLRLLPAKPDRQDGSTNAVSVSPSSLLFRLQGKRVSSVGVATRYWLDGPESNPRGGAEGARLSFPAQTGPGTHPASCAMGTGSYPGVKWPRRDADHPPTSRAEDKERAELYLYCLSALSQPVEGQTFTFYLQSRKAQRH